MGLNREYLLNAGTDTQPGWVIGLYTDESINNSRLHVKSR